MLSRYHPPCHLSRLSQLDPPPSFFQATRLTMFTGLLESFTCINSMMSSRLPLRETTCRRKHHSAVGKNSGHPSSGAKSDIPHFKALRQSLPPLRSVVSQDPVVICVHPASRNIHVSSCFVRVMFDESHDSAECSSGRFPLPALSSR